MKIIRFHGGYTGQPYAYVKCWPWEKLAILRKMKRRTTGLHLVTWEPGPKAYGASFIIASVWRRYNQRVKP
jgi:hypothetical protein